MSSTNTPQNANAIILTDAIRDGWNRFNELALKFGIELERLGLGINKYHTNYNQINQIAQYDTSLIKRMFVAKQAKYTCKPEVIKKRAKGKQGASLLDNMVRYNFYITAEDMCSGVYDFSYPPYQRIENKKTIKTYANSFLNGYVNGVKDLTLKMSSSSIANPGIVVFKTPHINSPLQDVIVAFIDDIIDFDVIDGQHNIKSIVDNRITSDINGNDIIFGVRLIHSDAPNTIVTDEMAACSFVVQNSGKRVTVADKKCADGDKDLILARRVCSVNMDELMGLASMSNSRITENKLHTFFANFYGKSRLCEKINCIATDVEIEEWLLDVFRFLLSINSKNADKNNSVIGNGGFYTLLGTLLCNECNSSTTYTLDQIKRSILTAPMFNERVDVLYTDVEPKFTSNSGFTTEVNEPIFKGCNWSNDTKSFTTVIKKIKEESLFIFK